MRQVGWRSVRPARARTTAAADAVGQGDEAAVGQRPLRPDAVADEPVIGPPIGVEPRKATAVSAISRPRMSGGLLLLGDAVGPADERGAADAERDRPAGRPSRFGAQARPSPARPRSTCCRGTSASRPAVSRAVSRDPTSEPMLVTDSTAEVALAAPAHVGQLGQRHAVVEGERGDDGHHDERDEQLAAAADERQRLADRAPAARRHAAGRQLLGAEQHQRPSTAPNDAPLSRKHHAVPTVSTITAASAGPKMRDPVITAVFSDDGVADVLRLHELGDEAPPRRVLEGVEHTDHQRERPHDVHRCQAGEVEDTEQQGLRGESVWRTIASLRLSRRSATAPAQAPSSSIGRNCRATVMPRSVARPVRSVDQQGHRRDLQPRADVGHEQSAEEDAGVAVAQAAERRHGRSAAAVMGRPSSGRHQSSSLRAEMNTSPGTSTRPIDFIFFLPSFCFSSSLRLRVMSPP